jgi:ATP/maltotriose-dependent transcriptional regulator MalT
MTTGDFARAGDVLDEGLSAAEEADDARLEARALIEREFHRIYAGTEEASQTIPEITARAIPVLEEAGDHLGLARAWWLRSEVAVRAAHWGARAEALEIAHEQARLAGDLREEARFVALLAVSLYYGPMPVEEAVARCERFLTEVTGDRSLEAAIENTLAGLRAMLGEFDEARRLWIAAYTKYDELGLNHRRAARSVIAASIELLAGDFDAAERELRWAYDTLERMGDKGARAPVAAFLGDALYAQGRLEEADEFAEIARELAATDDLVPQVIWRSVRAKVLANRGELDEAERLAREAYVLIEGMDFPDLQAATFRSLAEVLESAAKPQEAEELVRRAQELYRQKGNLAATGRIVPSIKSNGRNR